MMDNESVNSNENDQCINNKIEDEHDLSHYNDSDLNQTPLNFDQSVLMSSTLPHDRMNISSQLASSGMAGMAAAAAIATANRSSTMLFSFETVPAARKRHSTRLLRKIQQLVDEFSIRVGQQAVLLVCNPKGSFKTVPEPSNGPNSQSVFKVFGVSPLDIVVRNLRDVIIQDLEAALQNYNVVNPTTTFCNPGDVLPPLMVDGIPTSLDKMTQAQLRAFIPVMLKYSTGRSKPSWGRPSSRPTWWPSDVPWANVRSDVRTEEEKQQQSWTNALKKVVRCCYEYHGKAELLHGYTPVNNGAMMLAAGSNQHPLLSLDGHHHHHQYLRSGMEYAAAAGDYHHQNATNHISAAEYAAMNHHNVAAGRHMLLNHPDEGMDSLEVRAFRAQYGLEAGQEHNLALLQQNMSCDPNDYLTQAAYAAAHNMEHDQSGYVTGLNGQNPSMSFQSNANMNHYNHDESMMNYRNERTNSMMHKEMPEMATEMNESQESNSLIENIENQDVDGMNNYSNNLMVQLDSTAAAELYNFITKNSQNNVAVAAAAAAAAANGTVTSTSSSNINGSTNSQLHHSSDDQNNQSGNSSNQNSNGKTSLRTSRNNSTSATSASANTTAPRPVRSRHRNIVNPSGSTTGRHNR